MLEMPDSRTYRLNEEALEAIRELRKRFKKEVGREPGADDDCVFDPDSSEPQPAPKQKSNQSWEISLMLPALLPIWRSQSGRPGYLSLKETRTDWMMISVQPGLKRSQNTKC